MANGATIADKLDDLAKSKAAIVAALTAKGVTVPEGAKFEDLPALAAQLEGNGIGMADTCEIDRHTAVKIVIPYWVTKIGRSAFPNCLRMTSLTLSKQLKSIGAEAFINCVSLTSLTIPEGVTSIQESAFANCHSMVSLSIPSTVTSVGASSFNYCPAACDIHVAKTKAEVSAMNIYQWGFSNGAVIHCTDGDITVA